MTPVMLRNRRWHLFCNVTIKIIILAKIIRKCYVHLYPKTPNWTQTTVWLYYTSENYQVKLLKIVVFVRKLVAFLIATMEKGCGGTVSEYTKYFIILSFSFK